MSKLLCKIIPKYLTLFLCFGSIYFIIETLYKQKPSDISMFILGGVCGILVGLINNLFTYDTSFILQCFVGTLIVLLGECIVGYQLNIIEGKHIWDYSALPLSYVGGQINLIFACAWFVLSGIAIFIDDIIRWLLFKEEKPHYTLFGIESHKH